MPMTMKRSKLKPEVEFQYGGRLFLGTGSACRAKKQKLKSTDEVHENPWGDSLHSIS